MTFVKSIRNLSAVLVTTACVAFPASFVAAITHYRPNSEEPDRLGSLSEIGG